MNNCSEHKTQQQRYTFFLKNFLLRFPQRLTHENAQTYYEKRKKRPNFSPKINYSTNRPYQPLSYNSQQLRNNSNNNSATTTQHTRLNYTHPAQSPLTQKGHVDRPFGASAQAAKEYGCSGEAAKTQR